MDGDSYEAFRTVVRACARLRRERDEVAESSERSITDLLRLVDRLTLERDELRREVCALDADTVEDQREYAAQRGWDCFGGKHVAPPA